MAEAKQKWDEVGDRFGDLGRHLKDRFDVNAAVGADEREKVNDALRQLGDALDAGFTTIGDTLRDPAMPSSATERRHFGMPLTGRRYGMTSMPSSASI